MPAKGARTFESAHDGICSGIGCLSLLQIGLGVGDVGRGKGLGLLLFERGERGVGGFQPLLRRGDLAGRRSTLRDEFPHRIEIMLRLVTIHLCFGHFAGERIALLQRAPLLGGLVLRLRAAEGSQCPDTVRDRVSIIQRQQKLSLGHGFSRMHVEALHRAGRRSVRLEVMLRLDFAVGTVGRNQVLDGRLRDAQRQLFAGEPAHHEKDNYQEDCGERPQNKSSRSAI